MYSLQISDELTKDIKSSIAVFMERGMTLDEALEFFLDSRYLHCLRVDLEDSILMEIWVCCRRFGNGLRTDEEGSYYMNERDNIIEWLMDDTGKSKGYLYNQIYRLRNKGFIQTEVKTVNDKRLTLLSLTVQGMGVIDSFLNQIRGVYEGSTTTIT